MFSYSIFNLRESLTLFILLYFIHSGTPVKQLVTFLKLNHIVKCTYYSIVSEVIIQVPFLEWKYSNQPADTDVFSVVASLHQKSNVCEPEWQNDFRDVRSFVLMSANQIKGQNTDRVNPRDFARWRVLDFGESY